MNNKWGRTAFFTLATRRPRAFEEKRGSTPFIVGAMLVMASSVVMAHHGWSGYREVVEMTMTVTALKLGNPHDRLLGTDEAGREWNLLLAPPARNRRFGFNEESVKVGDEIELYGQKHPDRNEVKVHCLYRAGEMLYTYRYDNGRSSLSRSWRKTKDSC